MAGSKIGGAKARETNKRLYGQDWYARIGKVGGSMSNAGGFASDLVGDDGLTGKERARVAGSKGGTISRRPKRKEL